MIPIPILPKISSPSFAYNFPHWAHNHSMVNLTEKADRDRINLNPEKKASS
jgi:hypothetical protein